MALSASDKGNMPVMDLDLFYNYVNVTRKVEGTSNDLGEPAITWAAVTDMSNVKADIQPSNMEQLKQMMAGLEVTSTHAIFFLSGADVAVDDRIEADEDGDGTEDTYYRVDAVQDWDSHVLAAATKE